jgi:hypothetical protein
MTRESTLRALSHILHYDFVQQLFLRLLLFSLLFGSDFLRIPDAVRLGILFMLLVMFDTFLTFSVAFTFFSDAGANS